MITMIETHKCFPFPLISEKEIEVREKISLYFDDIFPGVAAITAWVF